MSPTSLVRRVHCVRRSLASPRCNDDHAVRRASSSPEDRPLAPYSDDTLKPVARRSYERPFGLCREGTKRVTMGTRFSVASVMRAAIRRRAFCGTGGSATTRSSAQITRSSCGPSRWDGLKLNFGAFPSTERSDGTAPRRYPDIGLPPPPTDERAASRAAMRQRSSMRLRHSLLIHHREHFPRCPPD